MSTPKKNNVSVELEQRLLQIMFKHTPTATVGAVLVFVVDLILYRNALSELALSLWAGLFPIALVARVAVWVMYRRAPELLQPPTYRRLFTASILLHGISWMPMVHGALLLDDASMHLYAVLSVTGMAGALGSMAAWPSVFAAFVLPLAVATFSTIDLAGPQGLGSLALWSAFFGFIFLCWRGVNSTLVDAVRARLRNEDLADELRRQAERDPLTGLYNRRRFTDELESAWIGAERRGWRVGLLICDVDHFKPYNDTLGHQAGDECLQAVARALQQLSRRGESIVARLGGEEFVMLLRQVDGDEQLEAVAERIRKGIEAARLSHPASPDGDRVTMSIGAASAAPADEHASSHMLVELADQALYRAKQAGRNCAKVSPCLAPQGDEGRLVVAS